MRVRLMVLGAVIITSLSGCFYEERICGSEDYPVKAVGSATGQDCVPKGQEPPEGYVRYPKGQEPEVVGDEWDEYWSNRVLDENGNVVGS